MAVEPLLPRMPRTPLSHDRLMHLAVGDPHPQYALRTDSWAWDEVYKTASEAVQSFATPEADDELLFAVAANELWVFEAVIYYFTDTTADLDMGFSAPSGAGGGWSTTGVSGNQGFNMATGSTAALRAFGTTATLGGSGTSTYNAIELRGLCEVSSTAGNVEFVWSQDVSTATDTGIYAGSYIKSRRVSP